MEVARIQALYEYNTWANGRVLEVASHLTPEQFLRNLRSSYPSVRDTLAHVIGGEWIWLMRWKGSSPKALLRPSDFPTLAALNARWLSVQREQSEFVSRVTDASLAVPVAYINTQGDPFSYPLWQTMQHVVNHSTYHRGQFTTLLRQLDAEPVATDFLVFYDVRTERQKGVAEHRR